jgi:hypothetical protein
MFFIVCVSVTACTDSERDNQRAAYLEELVADFDAQSLGEVLCEFDHGEAGGLTQLHHSIVIAGSDKYASFEPHLEKLGYSVSAASDGMAGSRGDSTAAVEIVERPGANPHLEETLEARGCGVPDSGVVVVTITEHAP